MPLVEDQIAAMLGRAIATEAPCPVEYEGSDVTIDDDTPQWITFICDDPIPENEYPNEIVTYRMPFRAVICVRDPLRPDAKATAKVLRAHCVSAIYRGTRQLEGLAMDVSVVSTESESLEQENADPAIAKSVNGEVLFGTLAGDLTVPASP